MRRLHAGDIQMAKKGDSKGRKKEWVIVRCYAKGYYEGNVVM